jgi:hypothetical protein
MALWASCLIWRSNCRRVLTTSFFVVGMTLPTTAGRFGALAIGSTHGHQVMGDDAPADMPFKSNLTFIKGSPHPKAVFERAQARAVCAAKPSTA